MELKKGTLSDDINRWIQHFVNQKVALGLAKSSLNNYTYVLNSFTEFSLEIEEDIDIYDLNSTVISHFLIWKDINNRKNKPLSQSSKNLHISVIKDLFLFISQENDEQIDLTKNVKRIKQKKTQKVAKFYTTDEIEKIVYHLDDLFEKKSKIGFTLIRNILMLKIFLLSGIRANEMQKLTLDDIKVEDDMYTLKIEGKGNKERILFIKMSNIEKEFRLYKRERANLGLVWPTDSVENKDYIAITSKGNQMDRSQITKSLNNLLKKILGIGYKRVGLHGLRRSYANYLSRISKKEGVEIAIQDIQHLLGHNNIQTTILYLNHNESNKKNISSKISF